MDLGLSGKTAIVTGSATGIGRSIVELLVDEGVVVAAVDRNAEALEELTSTLQGVSAVNADLSTFEGCRGAVSDALSTLGGMPNILINNAGIGRILGFEEIEDEQWVEMLNINFLSVVRISRQLLPEMAKGGGGAVVNVTSDLAGQPEQVFVDYQAAKAALVNFSKTMALTYAPSVRVNNVAPGPIWTPLWTRPGGYLEHIEKVYSRKGDEAVQALIDDRGIPLARMGLPEEVANAAVFLASDRAGYTTGSTLSVNGGTVRQAY